MNMPAKYIDIHSHRPAAGRGTLTIQSLYRDFERRHPAGYYSLGLHPWYLHDAERLLGELEAQLAYPEVRAVGECGLDRTCPTDMRLQQKVFARQIRLANDCRKPLVIHCVRAFPETLAMLKEAEVPAVFHGFNKKQAIADDILAQGHYLSFGAALLRPGAAAQALARTPAGAFFLETDDSAGAGIEEIYRAAGHIRKTGEDALILQLQKNFQSIFGRGQPVQPRKLTGTGDQE